MIDILLATYNAEKHIKDQIESILNQNVANWRLIIRDDCSTDNTWDILNEYATNYPHLIELHRSKINSGAAKNNFFYMLKYVKQKYIIFCDQDDIWAFNKIEILQRKILEMESIDKDRPLLVHSDAIVVDENLNCISNSLFKLQCFNPTADKLNNLLVQNIVTGCTMIVNKTLIDIVQYSENVIMHDWWFALIACCFGNIGFISEPLLKYRQHNDNSVGAKHNISLTATVKRGMDKEKIRTSIEKTYKQAKDFLDIYESQLDNDQKEIINKYLEIPYMSKLEKITTVVKYKFLKNGLLLRLGQIFYI